MPRHIDANYQDPTDLLWLRAAEKLGISVVRSADAYAAWDGRGTLTLATDEHLDPDDCLAQMILHEVCHLLVSGEAAREQPDWGLDNTSPKDLVYEYATNRLQAALAQPYGLREFMAVTTVWRRYYDALPRDPLSPSDDAAAQLARSGWQRAQQSPYRQVLHEALSATAAIAALTQAAAPADSLWQRARGMHAAGFALHTDASLRCGDCAWASEDESGALTCRQTHADCQPLIHRLEELRSDVEVDAQQRACEHYEPRPVQQDCFSCGACCHRGFDVVEVGAEEEFAQRHPDLIAVRSEGRYVVPRREGHCVALTGKGTTAEPYLCRHYEERPRSCRDFAVGGDACLIARRRCGIYKSA